MPGLTATLSAPAAASLSDRAISTLVKRPNRFVRSTPVTPAPKDDAKPKEVAKPQPAPLAKPVKDDAPAPVVLRKEIEDPPRYGEKRFEQLVVEAFEGPALRLTRRMKLIEEADARHIRRGDALEVIAATKRMLERKHHVQQSSPAGRFATRYAAFAAAYLAMALAWCGVMALQ